MSFYNGKSCRRELRGSKASDEKCLFEVAHEEEVKTKARPSPDCSFFLLFFLHPLRLLDQLERWKLILLRKALKNRRLIRGKFVVMRASGVEIKRSRNCVTV